MFLREFREELEMRESSQSPFRQISYLSKSWPTFAIPMELSKRSLDDIPKLFGFKSTNCKKRFFNRRDGLCDHSFRVEIGYRRIGVRKHTVQNSRTIWIGNGVHTGGQ